MSSITNISLNEDMVFIYIGGVSSSDPDFTKEYEYNVSVKISYVFESVSYISSKRPDYVIDDILTGRIDAQQLLQGTRPKPDTLRKAIRLNNLVSIISFYMRFTLRKIVVIGVSHGSLIVHAAILKIKAIYRPFEELYKIFDERIIVLTLGSPKYLPISLLSHKLRDEITFGNVYNFYNTKDAIYSVLNAIRKIGLNSLSYLKFPELQKELVEPFNNYTEINNSLSINYDPSYMPKYKYDQDKHLFFVKNTENLKYFKGDTNTESEIIKKLCEDTPSIIFFHSILFHFFPIFQGNLHIIHYMRNITSINKSSDDTNGNLKQIENRSVFALDLMNGGRKNKKIRKVKKYLKK